MKLTKTGFIIKKYPVYRLFIFCLIICSVFRDKIPVSFGVKYIKVLEMYIIISFPLIIFICFKHIKSLFTQSGLLLCALFLTFFLMNYISGKVSFQYIIEKEKSLYYFRLGLIFIISLTLFLLLTSKCPFLMGAIYKGFLAAGILIILWIFCFPEYKTSIRRFTGPFGDPNYTSSFLLISLNIALYQAIKAKNAFKYIIHAFLSIAFFTTIVTSLSRGALIGAVVSTSMIISTVVIRRSDILKGLILINEKSFKKILLGSFVLMCMIISVFAVMPQLLENQIKRLSPEQIMSQKDQHRQDIWKLGVRSIATNPIGYGMGQMRVKHSLVDPNKKKFGHSTEVHNVVLQIGGAFGWPGLCFFVGFLAYLLHICFLFSNRNIDRVNWCANYPLPLVTSFIGLLLQAMLFNFLYLKHFWIVTSLVLSCYEYYKRNHYFMPQKKGI